MSQSASSYRLYLVPSASHAIKGETALVRTGIPCALIPVPRTVGSQCGVCLRVDLDLGDRAAKALEKADVQISGTYDLYEQDTDKGDRR
jgi:hypothetical protein